MSWPRKSPYDLLHGRQTFERAGNPWGITLSQNSRVVAVIGENVHSPARSALARTQHIRGLTYKGNQCALDVAFVQPFLNSYHHHLPWSSRALVEGVPLGGGAWPVNAVRTHRLPGGLHAENEVRGSIQRECAGGEGGGACGHCTCTPFCSSRFLARSVGERGGTQANGGPQR